MGERVEHPALRVNLVLIGGRGCGKTSLAKRIARTNRLFMLLSLDALVRYEAEGARIPEIVAREGWAGFRARELAVVEKVSAIEGGALIDTGGGVVVELDRDGHERYSARKVDALRKPDRLSRASRRERSRSARALRRRDVPPDHEAPRSLVSRRRAPRNRVRRAREVCARARDPRVVLPGPEDQLRSANTGA